MNHQCCKLTRGGRPCTIMADREVGGLPYCHVHDPGGTFMANLGASRKERRPAHRCCCLTKKRRPCPFNADREHKGEWYCHIHDPKGLAAQNARASSRSARSMETLMMRLKIDSMEVG